MLTNPPNSIVKCPHLRPCQQRGVGHVELVARLLERLAPRRGLLHALGGQVGVKPATEPDAETLLRGVTLLIEDLHTCCSVLQF